MANGGCDEFFFQPKWYGFELLTPRSSDDHSTPVQTVPMVDGPLFLWEMTPCNHGVIDLNQRKPRVSLEVICSYITDHGTVRTSYSS